MDNRNLYKAAQRGEPSYVWRAGQQRRLERILASAGDYIRGRVLENGCGVGMYLSKLIPHGGQVIGLEIEHKRAVEARGYTNLVLNADGGDIPLPTDTFDLILSHEVIEHIPDDRRAVSEMVRVLHPGGLIILFCPNRWYPFETHGIYWRGNYRFGNIPLVNYLPPVIRDRLVPHGKVYTTRSLTRLFQDLPVRFLERTILFGAYDNIIARFPRLGRVSRFLLQSLERTPLRIFGLSHYWVIEKL
jgi:SAM-dependent methyltransferase